MTPKYKSHSVFKERTTTNKDFTMNLVNLIHETYLGEEYIRTQHDIEGHFNWCYGKVCEDFFEEEIDFYENQELYDYFFEFFKIQFYGKTHTLSHYEKFWKNIFDYKKNMKNKRVMSVLNGLNAIFEKSYVLKKNKEPQI
jgi:hypothetical protein